MAISKKSSSDFALELENSILSRNSSYDTKIGPVSDLVIQPLSNVLELQNENLVNVEQLLSLSNSGAFTDIDLDQFVFNEGLIRTNGSRSTTKLIFSRSTPPSVDLLVRANFPVATVSDESTGQSITFVTLVDATMTSAGAPSFFNINTQRYELEVVAESTTAGTDANVAPNRIVRPLRALNGFDTVFNREQASGGTDIESNAKLIERYFLSLRGTSPSTSTGLLKTVRNSFSEIEDTNLVFGSNPLNVRSATDAGAVDVYLIGSVPTITTENIVFSGRNQVIPLSKQPILSITSAGSFVQGVDFEFVKDTTGNKGSVRAKDGIRWFTSGSAPSVGAVVSVTYTYDILFLRLQSEFSNPDLVVPGRDLLFKQADQIDVTVSANIKVRAGFNVASIVNSAGGAILGFINDLQLSDDVEASDLQAVVRRFSGVDNFVITNLSKVGSSGTSDILLSDNEFARIQSTDLILTKISGGSPSTLSTFVVTLILSFSRGPISSSLSSASSVSIPEVTVGKLSSSGKLTV